MPTPSRPSLVPEPLDEWRPAGAQASLTATLVAFIPGLVVVLQRDTSPVMWLTWLGAYGAVVWLLLLRGAAPLVKAVAQLGIGFFLVAVALGRAGLGGIGRSLLVTLPLYALLLIGRRAAAGVFALAVVMLGVYTALAYHGWAPALVIQDDGSQWFQQALGSLICIVPIAVLLERALDFQERAVARVAVASGKLLAEAEERRRLEGEVIQASERAQREVGNDLHDGLCQHLTAGLISARLLERTLTGRGAPEAEQAGALAEVMDAALLEARALAQGLSPGPMPQGGLSGALRSLARQVRETVEVDCEVTGEGAPSAGGAGAAQLFRIAQEATQNAVKHADASRITLELAEDGEEVRLAVRDNGKGLPRQAPLGLGLRSMKGRAVSLGGTLEVAETPGGGTQVLCRVPRTAVLP